MNTLARFVVRPNNGGDLLLGAIYKGQKDIEPGYIYEIVETLGEISIKKVGPAAIGVTRKDSKLDINWGFSVNEILDWGEKRHLLTAKEVENEKCSPQ
jgi:hypothetical protein